MKHMDWRDKVIRKSHTTSRCANNTHETHEYSESIMSINSSIPPRTVTFNPTLAQGHHNTVTDDVPEPQHTMSGTTTSTTLATDTYNTIIFGSSTASAPTARYTLKEREQRIDAYAKRVTSQIANIESGQEGERNVKFQNIRHFMEPAGYFSGGLLAAGYDPHEKIKVTFNTYVGMGIGKTLTNSEVRIYSAWEIAAGALAHDKVPRGGVVNFHSAVIDKECQALINALEPLGQKLQNHWEKEIAAPMRDASGKLERRSGKADTYVIRGALQSLVSHKDSFEHLSLEAKQAVNRTLNHNGQVIIPNVYGYPLSGYAFIPYTPYEGNYKNRPNQGLMIDLKHGAFHEIKGDTAFAEWAKNNRDNLKVSFNARDRQGGKDAHWPKAGDVLDTLIEGNNATYPGYQNPLKDQAIPVQELFNYTRSRDSDYRLEFDNLDNIASKYQEQNAKNAVWTDQTEVFGSSQQRWKSAKDFWGNTFGYVPIVGNAGNIVFGVHDGIYGKTADDRVGGNAGAVISGLQLAHELATSGVSAGLDESSAINSPAAGNYNWRKNTSTSDIELIHTPNASNASDSIPVIKEGTPGVTPTIEQPVAFPGMREIKFNGRTYFAADKPDAGDGQHYLLRVQHPEDPSKLASSGIIAKPDDAGVWQRRGVEGGVKWPWGRSPSPSTNENLTSKFSDLFSEVDAHALKRSEKFDEYLNLDENKQYAISTRGYEDNGVLKRTLNVSWQDEDSQVEIRPSEAAGPSEYGTGEYSHNFLLDLNRNDYTVIKATKSGDIAIPLNASGDAGEVIRQNRIVQFEKAIPDEDLRARISEVAHQGSAFPAHLELHNHLKTKLLPIVRNTRFFIDYDELKNTTQVRVVAKWNLNFEGTDKMEPITDLEFTTTRTFTIRESNEILGNRYVIDEHAPTHIEASLKDDSAE